MLQLNKSQLNKSLVDIGGQSVPFETTSAAEMFKSLLDFLRRQFPIVLFFVLIAVGLGMTYVLTTPPTFTAQTLMVIDTQKTQIFRRPEQSSGSNVIVSAMVDSEVEMLKSENVSLAVIKRFHLADDPEFIGRNGGPLQKLYWSVFDLFGRDVGDSEYERTRRAAAVFANCLSVKRVGLSYVIQVSFESFDPKRAAEIADAVANAYIVDQLQAKFESARLAGGWLRDRLKELREQASAAERAVVEFKAQNNIVSTGGSDKRLVGEQQVTELNSQLVIARAQVSEANARLERIQSVLRADSPNATVDATVTDTLKNDVINKLRSQYLTLAEREADWERRYGSNHLAVINLRNQMNEIRKSILDELRRIAKSYRSDYEIAKQRQMGNERQLEQAVAESQVTNRARVQLTELESNAQSYRTLYDDFLQRYTESVQAQSFPITEARVVTPAARPLTKSHPKSLLVLLISASGGMIFGLFAGYLRDLADRAFRTRDQVERFLGLDCLATVPKIKVRKVRNISSPAAGSKSGDLPRSPALPPAPKLNVGEPEDDLSPAADITGVGDPKAVPSLPASATESGIAEDPQPPSNAKGEPPIGPLPAAYTVDGAPNLRIIARRDELLWQVVDFPLSPYAEAIRSIKMAADLSGARGSKKNRKAKKILGITSSSPSEGKSTIAASLAQLISHGGRRVILVDCDLRAPRLTRVLAPHAKAGLLEVLSGDASLNDVVWTDDTRNLSFLPAVATARIPHTAEILSGDEIGLLFDRLRGAYDYVIVDLTPLVPVIDVRATQQFIDQYVFVIEWGRTKVDLVERSLKETASIYAKILGVVLNKVDNKDLKRYEGYGNYDHSKYYSR